MPGLEGAVWADRDNDGVVDGYVERQVLAILETVGGGDRPAAGGYSAGAGVGDGLGAARVPGVEQDYGIAADVQRGEGAGFVGLSGHD